MPLSDAVARAARERSESRAEVRSLHCASDTYPSGHIGSSKADRPGLRISAADLG